MVTNVSPSITASPLFTLMLVIVPEVSASMLFCIFMASSITTVSPAFTLSPTFTLISLMVPGRGATTGLPEAAVGAELVLAAEAEELLDSSLFSLRSSLNIIEFRGIPSGLFRLDGDDAGFHIMHILQIFLEGE